MRRYLYRCPVCRTTSSTVHTPRAAESEAAGHREQMHGGHHPDGQFIGEVDRRGRWYTDLTLLGRLHTRLADTLADLRDPKGTGGRLWAATLAWLTLTGSALTVLWVTAAALQP